MWRSPSGNIFVIDGAHRLSALIAWVHDDYGDHVTSSSFFGGVIPPDQTKAAEQTRRLVREKIGTYAELTSVGRRPAGVLSERVQRYAGNLAALALDLQWVRGDASNAEHSYFRINLQATPIDDTELAIIQARRKPNAIATRALIRAGTGYKYWSAFDESIQTEIEQIARDVHDNLFRPVLEEPIKTLDLPVAGRGYSAESVRMVYELVNFVNGVDTGKQNTRQAQQHGIANDTDGRETLRYLKQVRRAASRVAGNEPQSLGLHPGVYFYSATGRFQPTAFLAAIDFAGRLDERGELTQFTTHRARFEEFLVKFHHFQNLVGRHVGAGRRGLQTTVTMYQTILDAFAEDENKTDDELVRLLQKNPQLHFLQPITEEDKARGRNFSTSTKSAVFLRQALAAAVRCNICGARLPGKSMSVDHIVRKEDGGSGTSANAQLAHPYCNTGYKEKAHYQSTQRTPSRTRMARTPK